MVRAGISECPISSGGEDADAGGQQRRDAEHDSIWCQAWRIAAPRSGSAAISPAIGCRADKGRSTRA